MLKILQARLQQYVNHELQMFKLDLGKAEEPEIKLPISIESSKKQESSRKNSTFALLTKPVFDYVDHITRLAREISITSDTQMTPPLWKKAKKN